MSETIDRPLPVDAVPGDRPAVVRSGARRWVMLPALASLVAALLLGVLSLPIQVISGRQVPGPGGWKEPAGRRLHVAPNGTAAGDGSAASPLDLVTALSADSPVRPGDLVWLHGGRYIAPFTSVLAGTSDAPIVIRQFPGERAIIDATDTAESALFVRGQHVWFWGFEIRSNHPTRISSQPYSPEIRRGAGVTAHAPGVKLINLVVHDMSIGLEVWASSPDAEIHGNLIYHNGYAGPDRGHGHGIYAQNRDGSQVYSDNVLFGGFGHGIHAYGSGAAYLNNVRLEGNVVFNSGLLSPQFERNILLGGGRLAENPTLVDNYTYYSRDRRGGENNVGFAAGCSGATVRGNYLAHPQQYPLVIPDNCVGAVSRNVMIGFVSNEFMTRFPDNDYRQTPGGVEVVVRPNRFEPGRGHIVVFNWDNHASVEVRLDRLELADETTIDVHDAQNILAAPVYTGVYRTGQPLTLPMAAARARIALPAGDVPLAAVHTGREFGVFVVVPHARR